jgi:predicted dehydrogenase
MTKALRSAAKRGVQRRVVLKAAAMSPLFTAPYFVPATAFGANERILTGHIGMGGQGNANFRRLSNHAVAVCDVDQKHLDRALANAESRGRKCEGYRDYRRLLDRNDIDAVVIATPDHWHAVPVIHACQAGKDVYCEKPLSLTVAEGRAMVAAARKHQRIVQTGSQQRSAENFRRACELVRSGKIGQLQQVLVGIPGPNHPGEPVPDGMPPAELDYDFWLGPAPARPYNAKRVHYNFRFFWDYSGGQMTNFGAHHIDIAHWGMGVDDGGPLEVSGQATFHPQGWHEVTETCRLTYRYPNNVTMVVGQGQADIPQGTTFLGTNGQIYVNRGKLTANPPEILKQEAGPNDVRLIVSADHHQNFLDSIRTRELPICDVEIGHRTAVACHLGNIAVRLGRTIPWDAANETIPGDAEAQAMLQRPHRAPWGVVAEKES